MDIAPEAIALIKKFEGFSSTPYRCPAGVWTIGYGTTRGVTAESSPIDEAEAEALLVDELQTIAASLHKHIRVSLTRNQHSGLLCLIYNIGIGAFARSTMLKKINAGVPAEGEFLRWVYAKGRRMRGLERRRLAERELYLTR